MNVAGTGSAASASPAQTPSLEQQAAELVKFAEGKPTLPQVAAKMQELERTPLVVPMGQILQTLAPLTAGLKTAAQQLALFESAAAALLATRQQVAAGQPFEVARAALLSRNELLTSTLARGIDSQLKLDLGWAMFELSAVGARSELS